jgi:antitoxin component YwqK of YwqJK toxin-antitoxin module
MEKLRINKNIILLTVILVGGCTGPVYLEDLLLEEGRYLHPRTGKLYTGSAVKMAPEDHTLVMDLNLVDGLFHGPYTNYDAELYYIAGPLRTDRGAIVIEEGMMEMGRFDQGLKSGMVMSYYGDGTLFRSVNYQAGKWEGTLSEFRKNGEKTLMASFVNDEMHGFFESYWLNDEILRSGYYDRGKRCGIWFDYGNNNEYDLCPEKFRGDS